MSAVLRARELPAVGGDTLWADAAATYEGLSDAIKARIEPHRHPRSPVRLRRPDRARPPRGVGCGIPPQHHPIVRTHSDTGARVLFVNASFTSSIDGLDDAEGAALLAHLLDQFKIPEYQTRFRWTPNAVAIWDNRATQHYPVADYWPSGRRVERVTITGDRLSNWPGAILA